MKLNCMTIKAFALLLFVARAQRPPFENTATCGDFKCEGREMFTCPEDCAAEITNEVCSCVIEQGACEQTCDASVDLGKQCGIYVATAVCGNILPPDVVYADYCGGCPSSDFSMEDDLDFSTGNGEDYYWDSSMSTSNQPELSMASSSVDSSFGTAEPSQVSFDSTFGASDFEDSFGGPTFLDESMGESSVCGDLVCDGDELTTCPQDCAAEITNAMCDCVVAAGACDLTCVNIFDLGEECSAYGALGICGGVIPFDVKYSVYCGGCHNIPSGSSLQPTQVPSELETVTSDLGTPEPSDFTVDFEPTSVPSFTVGTSMHPTSVPSFTIGTSMHPTSVPSFTIGTSMHPTSVPTSRVSASLFPTSVPSDSTVTTGTSMLPTSVPTSRVSASLLPTSVPSDSSVSFEPTSVPSFTTGTSMRPTMVPTSLVSASLAPTSVPSDSSTHTSGLNTQNPSVGTPEPSDFAVDFEPTSVPSFSSASLLPTSEPSDSFVQTSDVSTSQPSSFNVLTVRDLRQIRRVFRSSPSEDRYDELRVLVDGLLSGNQNLHPDVAAVIGDLQKSLSRRYSPRGYRQAKRVFRYVYHQIRTMQQ